MMRAAQRRWVAKTRRRRQDDEAFPPFAPGLVPEGVANPGQAYRAAAAALVTLVAQRRAAVGFQPGSSWADVVAHVVNLDASLLAEGPSIPWAEQVAHAERLLGVAIHEAAHLWLTPPLKQQASLLFRWVHNLLEDERIECVVAREFPALAHPLRAMRQTLIRREPERWGELELLFAMVRIPDRIPPRDWAREERFLRAVGKILDPYPQTAKAALDAVPRIIELLPPEVRSRETALMRSLLAWDVFNGREDDPMGRLRGGLPWADVPGAIGTDPPVIWRDAPPDPAGYERLRLAVAADANRLAVRLRALLPVRARPRQRQGALDRKRLHAWTFDDRLFRGLVPNPQRLTLVVIVDLSGSMAGRSAERAQRHCVTLAEAAQRVPGLRLYAYGHTADADNVPSTQIVRFATPARGRVDSFGSLPLGRNNRDAHAYDAIAADLRQREGAKRSPRLGILICDGKPAALGFRGREAVEAARRSIQSFERFWGPTLLLGVAHSPVLRSMATGPHIPYDPDAPVDGLLRFVAWGLRNQ